MSVYRMDDNYLMNSSKKDKSHHQAKSNSESKTKESSRVQKNKTFKDPEIRGNEDNKLKPDSVETIFISGSELPSQHNKDENRNSNLTTPKIKQVRPLFPVNEMSVNFKNNANGKKNLQLESKKFLSLDQVNISPIKFNNYKNETHQSKSKTPNEKSQLSLENSFFLKQQPKDNTHSLSKSFHNPYNSYEKVKDKSKNYDTNNNSYKDKTLNVCNEIKGFNSNSELMFENPQLYMNSKNLSNEHDRKNEMSLNFQNSFDFEHFQKNDSKNNFSSKSALAYKQNPHNNMISKPNQKFETNNFNFDKMNNFSMNSSYGIKNFFDYEPEESNNPLLFDNSFKGDEMIRSGERGLKFISKKAQEIVLKKKNTSFKEVADILINYLPFTSGNDFKEKQNIKRRVYDALNVLIATDVLQKKGKEINVTGKHLSHLPNYKTKDVAKYKSTLEHNILEKKQTIEKKRENFVEIFSKLFSIQILTHRNLEAFKKLEDNTSNSKVFNNINENYFFSDDNIKAKLTSLEISPNKSNKQVYIEDVANSIQTQETIPFPYLLIEFQDPHDAVIYRKNSKELEIHAQKGMNIFGDLDILRRMEMHKQFYQKELMETLIPREIYQYLPPKMIKDMI